jgi:hypothetical protein
MIATPRAADRHAARLNFVVSLEQLVPEDALRLAVLLAGEVHAVRIDEAALAVHALTPRGEARVELHPDVRAERYLMRVREALAGQAMGSPGGYPVHLRRWTRSGHASPKNLEALLRLGEPEAVTAVALSANLTDPLARHAWWAHPTNELARSMLAHPAVRGGAMGPLLARHLMEHLPFEEEPDAAMASVEAIAAASMLDEGMRTRLWRAAANRPHYLIGWIAHARETLPPGRERAVPAALAHAAEAGDALAVALRAWYGAAGQGLLQALTLAVDKPPTHLTVYRALDLVGKSFALAGCGGGPPLTAAHDLAAKGEALLALAAVGRQGAEPILVRTTAVGPLMRRHLAPVLAPVLHHLRVLQGLA